MNIHICILSIHLYIMTYVSLLYTHVYDYSVAHIYIYICIYIYVYTYIHTHLHILISYGCIVHAQDRHVQQRPPRHQLYEVLEMSTNSYRGPKFGTYSDWGF